ncbi:MAG: Sensor histidine kinase RcsC [Saprospiraceae bacterium]|nr:Sensor histidine kinase RcsC [Saprospiraceae bacterium]
MRPLKKISTFLFLISAIPLFAQNVQHQLISTADGLSQGNIHDLIQTRDGFIWIGTSDGLNRYDGRRFETFASNPFAPFSISNNVVCDLFEDKQGLIWILLEDHVNVFDPESRRFFRLLYQGKPIEGWSSTRYDSTPDGTVWLTNGSNILKKIRLSKSVLEKAAATGAADIEMPAKPIVLRPNQDTTQPPLEVFSMICTNSNKLLLGTNIGLFQFDPETEQLKPFSEFPDFYATNMLKTKSGDIILKGYDRWLWISNNGTKERLLDTKDGFGLDAAGYLWLVNPNNTIQKWAIAAFFNGGVPLLEIPLDAVLNKGTISFLTDQSGVVWMGTNGYGIIKLCQAPPKFTTHLPNTSHRTLLESPDGTLYSLVLSGKKYNNSSFSNSRENSDYKYPPPIGWQYTSDFFACFDQSGNGWSSRRDKTVINPPADMTLYRTDAVTKAIRSFPWIGSGLLCDRNGDLLSVSLEGLHKFNVKTETRTDYPFETPFNALSEYSKYLFEDAEGVIWIFGIEGLLKATPTNNTYTYKHYLLDTKDQSSLGNNLVLSVEDDPIEPGRFLWIGTKGGGLNQLDKKTGKFKHFKKEQGLPDNVIYGVLSQDSRPDPNTGFIWLSSNKGLCRFNVRTWETKNFTVADGLQDNEFNRSSYLKTRDGTMIFGGIKGLSVFHPDSLRFNAFAPQTRIVGIQVNNQTFQWNGRSEIKLAHDQNLINFEFAALEFTNPAQNQYRYQLVGVDEDWVDLGYQNNIQFANLAPGDYTFKVDGSNNDGVWSGQPAELRFTIRPPWWASWWAYLLYAAMGLAAVRLYYRYRLRQKLEHQETLRLREIDDFKSRFFTNITHEFRTPLTVILGMAERLTVDGGRLTESDAKGKLKLIKRNGESLLRLINQILDLAKLESNTLKINYIQGDVLTYLKYIAESLHSLANAQNVMLRVESDQPNIVMDYDPERFLQIIHNLLSNAIKFTPSGGKVILRAHLQDKWLHISVSDSGPGIPADELPRLFERFFQAKNQEHAKAGGTGIGLSLTNELVKAMGGNISVESTVGTGSTFLVKLPVTNTSAFAGNTPNAGLEDSSSSMAPLPVRTASNPPDADTSLPQILLIEDNPDVVEYLTACLQHSGDREGRYQLNYAYNGQAGIEKALESVPDLIVSDVMMPIKDGFEVLETLKNDERTSHIPIIMLTAKADVESRLSGLRRGADAYLAKPFNQEELTVTLNNLLELRRKLQAKYSQLESVPGDSPAPITDPEDVFLQKIRTVVEDNLSDPDFEMPRLERALAMSRSQIYRKVKALTGKSPSLFIRSIRLHHGRRLLQTTNLTVSEIAYEVGYAALNNFSDAFLEEFGERPGKLRG